MEQTITLIKIIMSVTFLHNLMPKGQEARMTMDSDGEYKIENAQEVTYMINMGPGSENLEKTSRGYQYSTPGFLNPLTGEKKTERDPSRPNLFSVLGRSPRSSATGHRSFAEEAKGDTYRTDGFAGRVWGIGWDDNVTKVMNIILQLTLERRPPEIVNLVGWSRGAVTCLRIANRIFDDLKYQVKINILAVDPVPGGTTEVTYDMKMIPPNVQYYLAIIALDDDRKNFQPIDRTEIICPEPGAVINLKKYRGGEDKHKIHNPPSNPPLPPSIHFLPFPGNHSTVVGAFKKLSEVDPGSLAVSDMVRHISKNFLSYHGTVFSQSYMDDPIQNVEDILHYYKIINSSKELIRERSASSFYGGKIVGGGYQERKVRKMNRILHTSMPDLFLNDHEHYCYDILKKFGRYKSCRSQNDFDIDVKNSSYVILKEKMPGWSDKYVKKYFDIPPQAHPQSMGLVNQASDTQSVKSYGVNIKNGQHWVKRVGGTGTYVSLKNLNTIKMFIQGNSSNTETLLPEKYTKDSKIISQDEWVKFSRSGFFAKRKRIIHVDEALNVYRNSFEYMDSVSSKEKSLHLRQTVQKAFNVVSACNYYLAHGGDREVAVKCLLWVVVKDVEFIRSILN
ncbi:hypothetical protein [Desulfonatronospira thiodismutans]|nr:hypothetical protein [Desulfonatronospira thiodismutans]